MNLKNIRNKSENMNRKFVLSNLDVMNLLLTHPTQEKTRNLYKEIINHYIILDSPLEFKQYPFIVHLIHNLLLNRMKRWNHKIKTRETINMHNKLNEIKIDNIYERLKWLRFIKRITMFNNFDKLYMFKDLRKMHEKLTKLNEMFDIYINKCESSLSVLP